MLRKNVPNRLRIVSARKVNSSVAYPFSKRVRTFFERNRLGKMEAVYFKNCLKQFGEEEHAFRKLKVFVKKPIEEKKEIIGDKNLLMMSMSFRLGEIPYRKVSSPKNRTK